MGRWNRKHAANRPSLKFGLPITGMTAGGECLVLVSASSIGRPLTRSDFLLGQDQLELILVSARNT